MGTCVGGLGANVVSFSVGRRDGRGVGGVGFFVGFLVGSGVGRQFVNAMHFIVESEHSVSCPEVQGSWHFLFTSAQSFPHQKECRISPSGMTSTVGPWLVGVEVGIRGSVGDSVGFGVNVGGNVVGESVGLKVGDFVGVSVISNELHFVPP